MRHLFVNHEGEMVAADTAEQAGRYYDCELGGEAEPGEWRKMRDDAVVPIRNADTGEVESKTAREWAEECNAPEQVATTYN